MTGDGVGADPEVAIRLPTQEALSGRPGYVTAMGVITAFDADPAGGCHSYYTKLAGVRLFNSSYTIPTL